MEFALTLPLLFLAALMVVQVAVMGADQVAVQAVAGQVARTAATDGAEAAVRAAHLVLGPGVEVSIRTTRMTADAADWVEVELGVVSRAFRWAGMSRSLRGHGVARSQQISRSTPWR